MYNRKGEIPMSKSRGPSGNTHSQEQLDHYANLNNPNNSAYQSDLDNHSDQLNPNNDKYQGKDDEK